MPSALSHFNISTNSRFCVHVVSDVYAKGLKSIHTMTKSKIKKSLPYVTRVTQKGGLMVSFVTLKGTQGVEQKLRRMAGADWVRRAPHPSVEYLQLWHVMTNIPRKVAAEVKPVETARKRTHEEEVALSIVNSVRGAISLGNLRRVSSDNGGVYTLAISVSVNEHKGLSNAKVTGTVKMVSSGEAEIGDSAQMELEFPAGRTCEECGEDISDSPVHFRYCEYCYKDTNS